MPILDVTIVGEMPPEVRDGLARRLADAAGKALASRPAGTWVIVRHVAADAYAENGGDEPGLALPVLASVLLAEPPEGAALAEQATRLTRAIAEACHRPVGNVHLIYEAPGKGRVAFGGRLRT